MKRTVSEKPKINLAHIAWILIFSSILMWGLGESRAGSLANTGNWYRMFLVPFATFLGFFALFKYGAKLSQAFPLAIVLLLLYGIIAISSSLYVPVHAFYTMWKGIEVVVVVMIAAAILSYSRQFDSALLAYKTIIFMFWALMILFWIEAALIPSKAFLPSRGLLPFTMQGVLPSYNGNSLAFLSAVLVFSSFCAMQRSTAAFKKVFFAILCAWAFTTLLFAQSRTSLFGLLVALVVYMLIDKRYFTMAVMIVIGSIAAVSGQFFDVAEQYVMRGQSEELFTSLSGRTRGWEAAWALFLESPLTGHGFAAAAREEILGYTGASTLHGAVFDVLVGVGIIGLIPWAVSIIWTIWLMTRLWLGSSLIARERQFRSLHAEMVGIMTLILIRSSTSSGLAMHEHTFMLFLSIVVYAAAATRLSRAYRKSPEIIRQ
jgi:O-antigen ligase